MLPSETHEVFYIHVMLVTVTLSLWGDTRYRFVPFPPATLGFPGGGEEKEEAGWTEVRRCARRLR